MRPPAEWPSDDANNPDNTQATADVPRVPAGGTTVVAAAAGSACSSEECW